MTCVPNQTPARAADKTADQIPGQTPHQTAAALLVDCLIEQGCDRLFTVPGESFLAVLDALHDRDAIECVTCRQEGGAAFMACADGAMTGRPGLAFVTRGPGATNASIGVHVAFQDSQPMILFVGDVARPMRDREGFQEVDFAAFFAPIAKWAARIDDAERIPEYIARAYATALSGRPGPVVLALPEDMLCEHVASALAPRPCLKAPAQAAAPQDVDQCIAMLRAADRPVAIIGGANWDASARSAFQQFAQNAGIPVATAFRRQDAIAPSSPVYAGNLGYGPNPKLVERVRQADLILALGARLGEATTDGYSTPAPGASDQRMIFVHPDPEEINRVYRADLGICAGMGAFAEALQRHSDSASIACTDGATAHQEWREWATYTPPPQSRFALDMGACVTLMRAELPADTIICNGAGNFAGWWHRYWRYEGFPTQLAPTSGAMGYGLPAAIAAARRFPSRTVVAVAGDGDFLMNAQELATAQQLGCDMIVIVVDNGTYGTIRMHQERDYPARVSATELSNPDFAAFAASFGAWSTRAETTEAFQAALQEAGGQTGIRLIHCLIEAEQLAASGTTISALRARE